MSRSRLPLLCCVVLLLAACGKEEVVKRVEVPAYDVPFACVADAHEVVLPGGPGLSAPMDPLPGCHAATLGNVKLPGGHTGPVTVFGTDRICHSTSDGLAVDIAPQVADKLAEALEGEATFTSVSGGEGCPSSDSGQALRQAFGTGDVLEVVSIGWKPYQTPDGDRFSLASVLRARLVETGSGKIVWDAICPLPTDEFKAATSFADDVDGSPALQRALSTATTVCAQQFAGPLAVASLLN